MFVLRAIFILPDAVKMDPFVANDHEHDCCLVEVDVKGRVIVKSDALLVPFAVAATLTQQVLPMTMYLATTVGLTENPVKDGV